MSVFRIPKKLDEIKSLRSEVKRLKALTDLAHEIGLVTSCLDLKPSSENEWIEFLRKAHKDFLNRLLATIGFLLILISGMVAVWRSF
tara:strand:+ start:1358 stop:1618 length:261 start_codon:yes stop_codon:yes gene_type:complete